MKRTFLILLLLGGLPFSANLSAQQKPDVEADNEQPAKTSVQYPLAIAIGKSSQFIVDLDLPGIWKLGEDGQLALFVQGSKWIRKPLNRPRCVAVLETGELLVGDTPTREVYRIAADGGEPKPLTNGGIGIPMSIAVDANQTVYVADLETHTIVRFPLETGKVETFVKANTRGISIDSQGRLWAVMQNATQLVRFDADGKGTEIVRERIFEFPHNVVVLENGTAFVTDGYAKAVWRVPVDGTPEKWISGEPMKNPVGLALQGEHLLVADPHAKQIFRIEIETKQIQPMIK
ncbi:MAG: NHL repeat-containing protein [Pirellulaceae bacterium]